MNPYDPSSLCDPLTQQLPTSLLPFGFVSPFEKNDTKPQHGVAAEFCL